MTWCNDCSEEMSAIIVKKASPAPAVTDDNINVITQNQNDIKACPACGHQIIRKDKVCVNKSLLFI